MNPPNRSRSVALHPVCTVVRLRAARKTLWLRQVWAQLPESPHPAAIQHEEVDRILSNPEQVLEQEAAFNNENEDAIRLGREIEAAEQELSRDFPWMRMVEVLNLDGIDAQLFTLAAALALDPSLGRAYAYLHDQSEMSHATLWLASTLFGSGDHAAIAADSPLLTWKLLRRAPDAGSYAEAWRGWIASPAAVAWLSGQGTDDLPHGARLVLPARFENLPRLYPQELAMLEEFFALSSTRHSATLEFELAGPAGTGRSMLTGQFAARKDKSLLHVDGPALSSGLPESEIAERVAEAVRAAALRESILFWDEGPEAHAIARRLLLEYPGFRVVARRASQADPIPAGVLFRSVELPPLTRARREELWRHVTQNPPPRQVRDWMLTPAEITKIAQLGAVSDEAIMQACRRPAESLSLLVKLPLPYAENDLILTHSVQEQLDEFERQIRLRWDVYEDWGFERLVPNGRGIVSLFAGPTGTGKTMAAQVLARKLGLELYRLDPAQVVNKYIGETEKRLKTVFDECDRAHFLLLIDECEGMFGQRFSSKDAHDRYANLEIDYLLQRLERFQGVAVLATNRKSDLDTAFLRRIRFVIDFLQPGPAERRKLWQNAIPEKSPSGEPLRGDIDWSLLAEKVSLTGAEIKLAALNAAFLAFEKQQPIGMRHLLAAIQREFVKKGQTLRGFERAGIETMAGVS